MQLINRNFHLSYLLFLLVVFQSCSDYQVNQQKSVFRYNESAGISSLDPAFASNLENMWWTSQIFSGLVQLDEHMQIQPCIAKSWEILDSGLTYRFHLRTDAYFHPHELFGITNPRKANARDCKFSFSRLIDPKYASPGAWLKSYLNEANPFQAINDSVLEIKLNKPFPPFLGMLSMPYFSVVPKEIVEHYGKDFRSNPIGTGPFKFNFWIEGTSLALVRNELYFEKDEEANSLPYLDAIQVSFVADPTIMFLDFLKGNYDMISALHPSYKDELLTAEGNLSPEYQDKIYLVRIPFLKTDYLGFLVDEELEENRNSPFLDKRVRKAFNYAIDRLEMVRYIKNNTAFPAINGFVPPALYSNGNEVSGYEHNVSKAKELMQEAGYSSENQFPITELYTTSNYVDLCEYVQHELKDIGVELKVEVMPTSNHRQSVANSQLRFFRKSWIGDYGDPENFLALFYSENFSPNGANYTHYKNAAFDKMYHEALLTENIEMRERLYRQLDSMVISDAPIIPLYYDQVLRFVRKNVEGIKPNIMNSLDLKRVRKL